MIKSCLERDSYILVIDSGNGGKYTLSKLKKIMPNEKYIYLEDDKNCPYGTKTKFILQKILVNLINFGLSNYPIKLIVIACNTLSSCLTNKMRNEFSLPIITITPKILNSQKNMLVLCTSATKKYNRQLKTLSKNNNIYVKGFRNLAKKIDDNIENLNTLQSFLDKNLKKYAKLNIRRVILGCTHYNLIRKQISNALLSNGLIMHENKYRRLNGRYNSNLPIVLTKQKKDLIFYENSENVALFAYKTLKALSLLNKNGNAQTLFLHTKQ